MNETEKYLKEIGIVDQNKYCLFCGKKLLLSGSTWIHDIDFLNKRIKDDNGYYCFPNENSYFTAEPNTLADRFLCLVMNWCAIRGDELTSMRENLSTGKTVPESIFNAIVSELDIWFESKNLSYQQVRQLFNNEPQIIKL